MSSNATQGAVSPEALQATVHAPVGVDLSTVQQLGGASVCSSPSSAFLTQVTSGAIAGATGGRSLGAAVLTGKGSLVGTASVTPNCSGSLTSLQVIVPTVFVETAVGILVVLESELETGA